MTNQPMAHGHEVIELVADFPAGITRTRLTEMIHARFGPGITFHTCSAEGMDLDALLSFLEDRDKVRIAEGVVFPGGSPACAH